MAGATTPPKTAKTTVSLGPLFQQATDQANAAIQPQIDTLASQQASADALAKQRELDAQNSGNAASSLIASLIKPVQGAYTAAAQNQELAGSAFSQGMQDALNKNTDNLNATLKSINAPVSLDSHAGEAGDVLYSLGGYNPGTSFAKQGAAAVQGLAGTASAANLLGQENAKSVRAQAMLDDTDFQNKIANIAATLPGTIEDNYMKLQQFALDNKKFALAVQNQKFDQAAKLWEQRFKTGQANEKIDEFNARQTLSVMKMNQQARQFAVSQANKDRDYQLALGRLGIQQKNLQMKAAAQEYKLQNGGFTPTQIARFKTKLQQTANALQQRVGPDGVTHFYVQTPAEKKADTAGTKEIGYADFVKAAVSNGAPLSLAIARANTIWPENQRPTPQELAGVTGMSAKAAAAAEKFQGAVVPPGGLTYGPLAPGTKTVIGHGPQGQSVAVQLPKAVTPALRNIVMGAVEYLGTPYAWGGESPSGFDCSGLAQYLYAKVGVNIPRTTYDQFKAGIAIPKGQLQAGDLVFFKGSDSKGGLPGHVGIYIGGGKFIEAPHTGAVVRVSTLAGRGDYQGARRYTS